MELDLRKCHLVEVPITMGTSLDVRTEVNKRKQDEVIEVTNSQFLPEVVLKAQHCLPQ